MSKDAPKISSKQLFQSKAKPGRFIVEASILGWRPGQFPVSFICEFPDGYKVFNFDGRDEANNELSAVRYVSLHPIGDKSQPRIEIHVLND